MTVTSILTGSFPKFRDSLHISVLYGRHFSCESSDGLFNLVSKLFSNAVIMKVDEGGLEDQMLKQTWKDRSKTMIIFPGAITIRDWTFNKSLLEKINVQNKNGEILLVGVCAGAFFLSKDSRFNKVERAHENYFPIFQGSCVGPVFGKSEDSSERGYSINITDIQVVEATTVKVAVSGAGYFEPCANIKEGEDYQVLARYESLEDQPIAVLACTPLDGHFNTLLIGPHFEYEAHDLKKIKGFFQMFNL